MEKENQETVLRKNDIQVSSNQMMVFKNHTPKSIYKELRRKQYKQRLIRSNSLKSIPTKPKPKPKPRRSLLAISFQEKTQKNTYICPTIQEAIQKNVHPIPEETQPKIWQFPAVPEATSNIPATAYSPLTDAMLQNAYQLQTVQMAMQNICPPLTFSGAPSILLIDVIRLTALYGTYLLCSIISFLLMLYQ
ncbi:hypothetical protein C2G38_2071185 [Gigaspora rosea]|uniref:Uncharacterized protein n=1 Tax=Gigaspora rosea TaxID=44941 RepID=A0A397VVG9_9GLOM|nr:hypothetical protein C2G38_2071185 [Gigaspora rosea]